MGLRMLNQIKKKKEKNQQPTRNHSNHRSVFAKKKRVYVHDECDYVERKEEKN